MESNLAFANDADIEHRELTQSRFGDGGDVRATDDGDTIRHHVLDQRGLVGGRLDLIGERAQPNNIGLKAGDEKSFSIAAGDAFGEYNPDFVKTIPRNLFPEDINIEKGAQLVAVNDDGNEAPFTVLDADTENVTADFNHALAGKTLVFDIKVLDVKETK